MPSLWFVMPVHGRLPLARICLRQLRRTCDALGEAGVEATAVIVAEKDELATLLLDELGFASIPMGNEFLSRRFNAGILLAFEKTYNPRPADYVVPIGSDDWVDWRLFTNLPAPDTMVGFQRISFVREDGREMTCRHLNYDGGSGIRIYPRQLMEPLSFWPGDDRKRACDTGILTALRGCWGDEMKISYPWNDARSLVDWKSPTEQLNTYDGVGIHRGESMGDPFEELAEFFPAEALEEMQAHYGLMPVAA